MTILQEKELKVLKEVIMVLEKYNLRYYAIAGTCLGAVRHGGFIPWDDDIDIAMPRRDYEYFRTILYKQLEEPYQKMDGDVSKSHNFIFMKVHDSSTTHIENYAKEYPDRITGAFVDIFPLDGVPDQEWKRKLWAIKYKILLSLNVLRRRTPKKIDSIGGLLKEGISKILTQFLPYNFFSNMLIRFTLKYDLENCNMVHYCVHPCKVGIGNMYPKSYFVNTTLLKFEDISIVVPKEYDKYLTQAYGDYMKLPKESERGNWHHVYISDMDRPCAYYTSKIEENLKKNEKNIIGNNER